MRDMAYAITNSKFVTLAPVHVYNLANRQVKLKLMIKLRLYSINKTAILHTSLLMYFFMIRGMHVICA